MTNQLWTPQKLLDYLKNASIAFTLLEHQAVFSVGESEAVDKGIEGVHCRNMFLKDKSGRMALVTLPQKKPVDLKKLSVLMGYGRFSFASPERLLKYCGVAPGSVSPFCILNDVDNEVELYLDSSAAQAEIFCVHPLINTMTIGVSPKDFFAFLQKHNKSCHIIDIDKAAP